MRAKITFYGGYRFRSCSEARWAVFFDTLEIPWEYEPELMKVGKYLKQSYIPDFYLPDHEIYFEVKGPEPTENEVRKAAGLAYDFDVVIAFNGMGIQESKLWMLSIFNYRKTNKDGAFSGEDKPILTKWGNILHCQRCNQISFLPIGIPLCKCYPDESFDSDNMPEFSETARLKHAFDTAKYYKFDKKPNGPLKNKTNKGELKPTEKMKNYARFLISQTGEWPDDYELDCMSFEEVSNLINEFK